MYICKKNYTMKFSPIFIVLIMTISAKSQNNFKQSWSIGFDVSNHIMAGDHRSIQTGLSDEQTPITFSTLEVISILIKCLAQRLDWN